MSDHHFDIAVFGSTPLATLVAGLLSAKHDKRTVLVRDRSMATRLLRGFDLSVAPLTRPETWELVTGLTRETVRVLAQVPGSDNFSRIDPLMVGSRPAGSEVLGHMRHMAMSYGQAVEPVSEVSLDPAWAAYRLRDAVLVSRPRFFLHAPGWLKARRVKLVEMDLDEAHVARDGSAWLALNGEKLLARQSVLADDQAILALAPAGIVGSSLHEFTATSLLTEPAAPIIAPFLHFTGCGLSIHQRATGALECVAPHSARATERLLGERLGHIGLRLAGEIQYPALAAGDGAPLAGRTRGEGAWFWGGLGPTGLFLAPALARLVAGKPRGAEHTYFAARGPLSRRQRRMIAEFAPDAEDTR